MDSMTEYSVGYAYGRALFDLGAESDCVADVYDDIAAVNSAFEMHNEFKVFMENPCISIAKRKESFEEVFSSRIGGLANKFFGVLIGNGKIGCLAEILRQFGNLVDDKNGIVGVTVTLSHEMDNSSIDDLRGKLAVACGKEVKMELIVEPSILGGIIINYGNSVIDNSMSRAIERALQ